MFASFFFTLSFISFCFLFIYFLFPRFSCLSRSYFSFFLFFFSNFHSLFISILSFTSFQVVSISPSATISPPPPVQPAQLPTFSDYPTTVVGTKPRSGLVSRHMVGEFSHSLACRELASFSAALWNFAVTVVRNLSFLLVNQVKWHKTCWHLLQLHVNCTIYFSVHSRSKYVAWRLE